MNYIFVFLVLTSLVVGIINGHITDVMAAMFTSCKLAVDIALSLIGIMAFWLGIMRIADKSGLTELIAKLIRPFTNFLFKDVKDRDDISGNIAMSISANALGLTNAATPIGIKVMKGLQEINKNKNIASDSMCMFLGMNTAGFQIIPATVIAILVGVGFTKPERIILPTLIVTTLSFITAIFTALILKHFWKDEECNND